MIPQGVFSKERQRRGGRPGKWSCPCKNSAHDLEKSMTNMYCFELTTKEYELVKLYVEALHRKIEE